MTRTDTIAASQPPVESIPRGTAQVEIKFYKAPVDGSQPFLYKGTPPEGLPAMNYTEPELPVTLNDIRGREDEFSLDKDAFQPLQGVLRVPYEAIQSEETIQSTWYPAVEEFLLDSIKGAHRVIIFDYVIRMESVDTHRKPLHTAHADQTAQAAAARVRLCIPDPREAEQALRGRYRIINVWKPLKGPVQSCPLAFARAGSVQSTELVPIKFHQPHRTGEIIGVAFNKAQEWLYWSGMQPDECLLLKCSDSDESVAGRVPHSAFYDPRTPPNAPGRESIEFRTLVLG
ncbi:methyltransferase [Aspergillus steynii IBT 23096]|uniref:Methyltransferase n=1 Tax=Aspergillus steynii IBT 23096 TaxID=1392250 RepID=A0A2I2FUU5_9EURO|nr:methyltransferase [Aspergillus steynii IBT 23096]PLB44413.1 methyltransferase [Aspergillus steynii IBT 23096]